MRRSHLSSDELIAEGGALLRLLSQAVLTEVINTNFTLTTNVGRANVKYRLLNDDVGHSNVIVKFGEWKTVQ